MAGPEYAVRYNQTFDQIDDDHDDAMMMKDQDLIQFHREKGVSGVLPSFSIPKPDYMRKPIRSTVMHLRLL